jgi:hypothetical protein
MALFDSLPEELNKVIWDHAAFTFEDLNKIRGVCKAWKQAVEEDEQLGKHFKKGVKRFICQLGLDRVNGDLCLVHGSGILDELGKTLYICRSDVQEEFSKVYAGQRALIDNLEASPDIESIVWSTQVVVNKTIYVLSRSSVRGSKKTTFSLRFFDLLNEKAWERRKAELVVRGDDFLWGPDPSSGVASFQEEVLYVKASWPYICLILYQGETKGFPAAMFRVYVYDIREDKWDSLPPTFKGFKARTLEVAATIGDEQIAIANDHEIVWHPLNKGCRKGSWKRLKIADTLLTRSLLLYPGSMLFIRRNELAVVVGWQGNHYDVSSREVVVMDLARARATELYPLSYASLCTPGLRLMRDSRLLVLDSKMGMWLDTREVIEYVWEDGAPSEKINAALGETTEWFGSPRFPNAQSSFLLTFETGPSWGEPAPFILY